MQLSNTDQLVFGVNELVSFASQFCTLKVGDLILTGSPSGSGAFRKPPMCLNVSYLKLELG